MSEPETQQPMPFLTAIRTVGQKYADFHGRATRPEFWWFALFSAVVASALGALNLATPSGVIAIGTSLASFWGFATLVPTLAVAVRRLRDAGRDWKEIFWLLIPIAGLIIIIFRLVEPSEPDA